LRVTEGSSRAETIELPATEFARPKPTATATNAIPVTGG
jgi:hypothetical protein